MESKNCIVCGREITWRKKWERSWNEVKYCGEKCRRSKDSLSQGHEEKLLTLLAANRGNPVLCPADEVSRQAARRLVHQGKIEIRQNGAIVEPSNFRGPIWLKLK